MVCTVCGAIGADARREVVQQIEYTRDSILAELEEARQMAIKLKNPSAAWQAAMAKAKILGLIIDRREAGDVGAFDALTDEELVALAAKKARELGLAGPQLVEDDKSGLGRAVRQSRWRRRLAISVQMSAPRKRTLAGVNRMSAKCQ
jgi:hypothetical protein